MHRFLLEALNELDIVISFISLLMMQMTNSTEPPNVEIPVTWRLPCCDSLMSWQCIMQDCYMNTQPQRVKTSLSIDYTERDAAVRSGCATLSLIGQSDAPWLPVPPPASVATQRCWQ